MRVISVTLAPLPFFIGSADWSGDGRGDLGLNVGLGFGLVPVPLWLLA
jgi:hypothetical protein